MTTSPASPPAATAKASVPPPPHAPTSPSMTTATSPTTPATPNEVGSDDDSDDSDPLADELRAAGSGMPYISLLARAKVLEHVAIAGSQRRNSVTTRHSSIVDNNQIQVDPNKRTVKKIARSSRSFRMSFVLNAGDDGLDALVNNISSESADRAPLVVRAVLALWQHRRQAAAMRQWKELLEISSDAMQRTKTSDVNEEARRILYSAEAMRAMTESAGAATPMSPRAGGQNLDVVSPVRFARNDLDLLVVWARQMQAKTFPPGVDDAAVRETMRFLRFRQYADGDALFFEGEVGELFYFVFQGTVAVYVGSSSSQLKRVAGTRRTTRIQDKPELAQLGKRVFAYRTGEGFGETAMFTPDAIRTASAVAVGACEVCELPKEVYKRTLKRFHQQFFAQAQTTNFVQRVALFRDWQRTRLGAVADVLEKRKLAFGDSIVVEGATVLTSCFFILSGAVKLTKLVDLAPSNSQSSSSSESNQSIGIVSPRTLKRRMHRCVELQTLGVADIVALEALLEPGQRATYTAVAATSSVELYVLKEVDARSLLGSLQSSLFQRVRELCANEHQLRTARVASVRQTLNDVDKRKRDAKLLQRQDDYDDAEALERSARHTLDAHAEAALLGATATASPLLAANNAAPYLPHLRATNLLELTRLPFVPTSAASRADHDALSAVASPKMLSTCAKNFIVAHAQTLASDYPERLRLHFPVAPAPNRALVEKITALMAPSAPTPVTAATTAAMAVSPRLTTRRTKPTSKSCSEQRVLDQQLERLFDAKLHYDANRKDVAVLPAAPARSSATTSKSAGMTPVMAVTPVRPTALHYELRATQDAARKLVDDHLRKVHARRTEATGPTTFLHFF